MAFKERPDLTSETVHALGGTNNKTGKPNPTKVEGYYVGVRECETDFGPAKIHFFDTADGRIGIWGKTTLNRQLTADLLGFCVRVPVVDITKCFPASLK